MTITPRTIYLSGPMSGHLAWNYPAFNAAAESLRALGHSVFNPAEAFDGDASQPRSAYMRLDVAALLEVDAVVTLPGWESSKGATLEVAIARELDLPVYTLTDLLVTP